MAVFTLDQRLEATCFTLIDWPLSRVLFKNQADYPWFILVPRQSNVVELTDLSLDAYTQLMLEIRALTTIAQSFFKPDKINVGALGNVVSQLHVHIVSRFKTDPLWPHGIWQAAIVDRTYDDPHALVEQLKAQLSALFIPG